MRNKGILITLEAGDGSGKATQTRLLYERLIKEGHRVIKVEYPDYESQSSALVRMYLGGAFGSEADRVNPFGASSFFAVDRYASYQLRWKKAYEEGAVILADRYTTSNMAHQAVKILDAQKRDEFLNWLWDFEFCRLALPVPDQVVFLDMPPEVSYQLIEARALKDREKDIHEKDASYLERCYNGYKYVADKYNWLQVKCVREGELLSPELIHEQVYEGIKDIFRRQEGK